MTNSWARARSFSLSAVVSSTCLDTNSAGRLRAEGRLGLRQAPLQVVAGNGVLVTTDAVDRLDAFLLGLQHRRERVAIGLEDGLGIKS